MRSINEKRLPEDAAEWDARLRAPDCTAAERMAFERWCRRDPANQISIDRLQELLTGLRQNSDAPEIRSLREAAVEPAAIPERRRRRKSHWALAICASTVIALVLFNDVFFPGSPILTDLAGQASFATAIGERSTANLDDGTVVVLNTNTQIRVEYGQEERLIVLLRGQALFDVAKDTVRPFVVAAGEQRITAYGTVFDVRLDFNDVEVTLVEGVVEVAAKRTIGRLLTIPTHDSVPVRLAAGQKLLTTAVATHHAPKVERTNVERATIWREGRVFFEDVPLSEAVAEMNRYSTVEIVLSEETLGVYRVNGMFRTGQQTNFVNALESYYPLETERTDDSRILLRIK